MSTAIKTFHLADAYIVPIEAGEEIVPSDGDLITVELGTQQKTYLFEKYVGRWESKCRRCDIDHAHCALKKVVCGLWCNQDDCLVAKEYILVGNRFVPAGSVERQDAPAAEPAPTARKVKRASFGKASRRKRTDTPLFDFLEAFAD